MAHIRLDQITERYLVDGIDVTIKGGVVTSAVVEVRLDDEDHIDNSSQLAERLIADLNAAG